MSELTNATDFELESATNTWHDYSNVTDISDSVTLNRWTVEAHDRLYLNGLNWDAHVDLRTAEVSVDGGSKLFAGDVTREGNMLTVTVFIGRPVDPERTFEFSILVDGITSGPRDVSFDETTAAITERHECEHCGDEFDTAHGLSVHEGMVHSDSPSADTETDATTDQTVAADGGQQTAGRQLSDVEIDLDEREPVVRTRDDTNQITYQLYHLRDDLFARTEIHPTRNRTEEIKALGRIEIEPLSLDLDTLRDAVAEEAEQYPDEVSELTDEQLDAIQHGYNETTRHAINEGLYGEDEFRFALVGPRAYYESQIYTEEMEIIGEEAGLSESQTEIVASTLRDALPGRTHVDQAAHAEFRADLVFDPAEPWEIRALELIDNSVLGINEPWRLCRVVALHEWEPELTQTEIADRFGISQPDVSSYLKTAERRRERARWDVEA